MNHGLYSKHRTDKKLESEGVQVSFGNNSKGKPVTFLLARAGGANSQYENRLRAELKPYRRQLQADTMDDTLLKEILRRVFIQTCIKGASNLEDEDNNPLELLRKNKQNTKKIPRRRRRPLYQGVKDSRTSP